MLSSIRICHDDVLERLLLGDRSSFTLCGTVDYRREAWYCLRAPWSHNPEIAVLACFRQLGQSARNQNLLNVSERFLCARKESIPLHGIVETMRDERKNFSDWSMKWTIMLHGDYLVSVRSVMSSNSLRKRPTLLIKPCAIQSPFLRRAIVQALRDHADQSLTTVHPHSTVLIVVQANK